jgi:hypothetical protein
MLVVIAPAGTGLLADNDAFWFNYRWVDTYSYGVWGEIDKVDIQVATASATSSYMWPYFKGFLMNTLGRGFGLAPLDDGIETEIMSWGSNGSGSAEYPQWGTGDLIGFGLVGANNGCVN